MSDICPWTDIRHMSAKHLSIEVGIYVFFIEYIDSFFLENLGTSRKFIRGVRGGYRALRKRPTSPHPLLAPHLKIVGTPTSEVRHHSQKAFSCLYWLINCNEELAPQLNPCAQLFANLGWGAKNIRACQNPQRPTQIKILSLHLLRGVGANNVKDDI